VTATEALQRSRDRAQHFQPIPKRDAEIFPGAAAPGFGSRAVAEGCGDEITDDIEAATPQMERALPVEGWL
jgi:hypothetical protein